MHRVQIGCVQWRGRRFLFPLSMGSAIRLGEVVRQAGRRPTRTRAPAFVEIKVRVLDFGGRTSSTSDLDLRLQLACVQKEQTLLQLDVEKIKLAQQEARERTALAQLPIEEVRMRIRQVELQLQEGHMSLARLQQERDAARITQVELQLQVKSSKLTSMRVQLEKEQHRASHVAAQADVAGAVTEQQKARLAEKATELETQLVRAGFPRGHGTDVASGHSPWCLCGSSLHLWFVLG